MLRQEISMLVIACMWILFSWEMYCDDIVQTIKDICTFRDPLHKIVLVKQVMFYVVVDALFCLTIFVFIMAHAEMHMSAITGGMLIGVLIVSGRRLLQQRDI